MAVMGKQGEHRPAIAGRHFGAVYGLAIAGLWVLGPFLGAGTFGWVRGWTYVAALGLGLLLHRWHVSRRNPELLHRRKEMGAGTKRWDITWNLLFWPFMVAIPVCAGLDVGRWATPAMPVALQAVGLASFAMGMTLNAWAMGINPHFEGTVRIQTDRGHRVIDLGPYRRVRHPGYVGLILWALGTPFWLASWHAVPVAAFTAAWVVLRTALEDATLRRELNGYQEYAQRVRARLLPGVW